jgi:hypothetical protein
MPWAKQRPPLAGRRNSARLACRRPRSDPTQSFAGVFDRAIDVDVADRNFVHLAAVGTINLQYPQAALGLRTSVSMPVGAWRLVLGQLKRSEAMTVSRF